MSEVIKTNADIMARYIAAKDLMRAITAGGRVRSTHLSFERLERTN